MADKCYESGLLAYLEGCLSHDESKRLKKHLASCKSCSEKFESLREIHELLIEGKEIIFLGGQSCPEPEILVRFHKKTGSLPVPQIEGIRSHMKVCPSCRKAMAALKQVDQIAEKPKLPRNTARKLLDLSLTAYPAQKKAPSKVFLRKVGDRLKQVKEQFEVNLFPRAPELAYAYYEMGGRALKAGKITLTVEEKPGEAKKYEYLHRNIRLGRSRDNDVILSDPSVSGHHAEIRYENNVYALYDLKSTNGTWLNNRRAAAFILPRSGKIKLGKTKVEFEIEI